MLDLLPLSTCNQLFNEVCNSAVVTLDVNRQRFPFIFSSVDAVEAIRPFVLVICLDTVSSIMAMTFVKSTLFPLRAMNIELTPDDSGVRLSRACAS